MFSPLSPTQVINQTSQIYSAKVEPLLLTDFKEFAERVKICEAKERESTTNFIKTEKEEDDHQTLRVITTENINETSDTCPTGISTSSNSSKRSSGTKNELMMNLSEAISTTSSFDRDVTMNDVIRDKHPADIATDSTMSTEDTLPLIHENGKHLFFLFLAFFSFCEGAALF